MSPQLRKNLIYGVLLLTLAAAVFAPKDDGSAALEPMIKTGRVQSVASATINAQPQLGGDLLPKKREGLAQAPSDLFYMETPEITAAAIQHRQPAAKPVAPPLPFVYMGKMQEDGKTVVFLTQNDLPIIAKVGDVLGSNYRVDAIRPPLMEFTYIPLAQKQTLNIGVEK